MFKALEGYKTYIVLAATAVYAGTGLYRGDFDWNHAIELVMAAGAGAGLRHGITTETDKVVQQQDKP